MEDGGAGYQKLLVARSNKRSGTVCRRMRLMPEDEEPNGGSSRKVKVGRSPRKAVDTYFGRLHY